MSQIYTSIDKFAPYGPDFLILTGASATGKTTIYKRLIGEYFMHPMRMWTTRPPRSNEDRDNDVSYSFVTSEEFVKAMEAGSLFCVTAYNNWLYGIPVGEFDKMKKGTVCILQPDGISQILFSEAFCVKPMVIELTTNQEIIRHRALHRGGDIRENLRRMIVDDASIKSFTYFADATVSNNIHDNIQVATHEVYKLWIGAGGVNTM